MTRTRPGIGPSALLAVMAWLAVASPVRAQEPGAEPVTRVYIVQLREPPAVIVARGARRMGKFDARAEAVRSYAAEQVERHDQLLQAIGAPDAKLYSYKLSFNGFAARLTTEQAARLSTDPAVARVWEDRARTLRTNASANYLGLLTTPDGLRTPLGLQGEDIVIGVIDSGIATGHKSFADTEAIRGPRTCRSEWAKNSLLGRWLCKRFKNRKTLVFDEPQQWRGRCETGEGFTEGDCNNKLIGARWYVDGFLAGYTMDENEFLSPRDADGHGTHIASIAAGNKVTASLGGTDVATISGIAPRARIAVYKACWLEPGATRATCTMSDLQRAIEDAVADGVDIINYAVGTGIGGPDDPDALALLGASDAGVLAVVAAGNSGPDPATIDSPGSAPWVLTVGAASRAGQRFDDAVRITAPSDAVGDLSSREGAFTPSLRSTGPLEAELVLADDGTEVADDACEGLLNDSEVNGRIVLVRRGTCSFQEKIGHAEDAGASAVVVFSDSDTLITMTGERDSVGIPAVMVSSTDGEALIGRLAAGEAVKLRLDKSRHVTRTDAGNVLYAQSSRGPNPVLPDILKPDVVAPGTDILGAQTSVVANGVRGESFQYLSGTSMAVPHVAGAAALLMEAHPDWSPAAIRSALVTTARPDVQREDGTTLADGFDVGAGYIVPSAANSPGLVYDAGREDYDAFACGFGIARVSEEDCIAIAEAGYPTTVSDLNLPSVTVSDVVNQRSVRRWVTNLGPAAIYQANITAPPGFSVSVSPATLAIGAGETVEFTVDIRNLGDPERLDDWQFGDITWASDGHEVRTPLAQHAQRLGVPEVVAGNGTSGSTSFEVGFGYDGNYEAVSTGLAAPLTFEGTVTDDPLDFYTIQRDDSALPDHVQRFRIDVPAGTTYLRVALGAVDPDSTDNLDLYLLCPDNRCPDGSEGLGATSAAADEVIGILDPQAGEYVLDVHGLSTSGGIGGAGSEFVLRAWALSGGPEAQELVLSPAGTATVGTTTEVTASWDALPPEEIYIGLISHRDGDAARALTLIEVISQ